MIVFGKRRAFSPKTMLFTVDHSSHMMMGAYCCGADLLLQVKGSLFDCMGP